MKNTDLLKIICFVKLKINILLKIDLNFFYSSLLYKLKNVYKNKRVIEAKSY